MAWYSSAKDLADEGKKLLGGVSVPKAKGYDVDPNAFVDPNAAANREEYAAGAAGAANRTGNQQFRDGQADLISTLQGAVAGNAPSVAESTLRGGADRSLAGAMALQASGSNATNPSLAMRAIGQAHAGISQNLARDAATLRAGEIATARGELGNVLGQARGGDLQQQAANDQLVSEYLRLGYSNDQASFMAQQELERLRVQEALGTQGTNAAVQGGNRDFWGKIIGAGISAGGAAAAAPAAAPAAASDEKTKKDVQPGGSEVQAFLDGIAAKGFSYKTPGAPGMAPGRHAGVMAQDVERAGPIGAGMVKTAPGGVKMLDAGQAAGTALAASADLNERVRRIESAGTQMNERETIRASAKPTVGRRMIDWIRSSQGGSMANAGAGG